MKRDDLLVWMDLEFTSLRDAHSDPIIEIAVILTDRNLQVVAEGPDLVIHADPSAFEGIPESALALHEKSGAKEASLLSTLTLSDAEDQVLAFLKEHVAPQTAPLCGNSIHVDRHYLRIQMPRVEAYLFYRCIDVSTVKELARYWTPAIYEKAREQKGESAHRAKDDILASIAELRFYRENSFAFNSPPLSRASRCRSV